MFPMNLLRFELYHNYNFTLTPK